MKTILRSLIFASAIFVAASHVAAQSSPAAFMSGTRYDSSGRIVGTIAQDPDGTGPLHHVATRNSFDAAGRLTTSESGELTTWQSDDVPPASWSGFNVFKRVEIAYNAMSNKTLERQIDVTTGATVSLTQYSYDNLGRLECTAVRMNSAAFGSPPSSACILGTPGNNGPDRITRNLYDVAGQLLKVQKAYGVTTANGFPTTQQQDYATYEYTLNGKQKTVIDANGNRAEMAWDGHDRQSLWRFPDKVSTGVASASDYEAYTYDSNGNRLTLRKRDGRTISYTYDALNRMASKLIPDGCAPIGGACAPAAATRDVYYGYDLRGLQTGAWFDQFQGTDGVLSEWDGFGRQTKTITNMAGTIRYLNFGFDPNGNRTSIAWADGNTFTYGYDDLDRLTAVKEGGTYQVYGASYSAQGLPQNSGLRAGTLTDSSGYQFDGVGRLTGRTTSFGIGFGPYVTFTFGYNSASQLVSRSRSNDLYAFGGYLNVNRSYVKNGLNQYTQAGNLTLGYDANGNLTTDSVSGYGYDVENRLVSGPGTTVTWDPLGRLYQVAGPSSTTQFLYDGDQLAGEYNISGTMLRRYAHGAGEDDPLIWYEGSTLASRRALHSDHQGSIIAVSDGSSVTPYSYDEYGIPGANQTARFQYTGQAWIPELGMYHYKARFYSPTLGRFLQTDPIGYDDQINLYAYVANDPVNSRDPDGERKCTGFIDCVAAGGEFAVETAAKGSRWVKVSLGIGVASEALMTAQAVRTIRDESEKTVRMTVYRVFDDKKAMQSGRYWSFEDPRKMANWRDRLAVYPDWNEGTKVVRGTITMNDMRYGRVQTNGNPRSAASSQPADPLRGGGPYRGGGNELIIPSAKTTVQGQVVYPMHPKFDE